MERLTIGKLDNPMVKGWIDPEGRYYGTKGDVGAFLHVRLAGLIKRKVFADVRMDDRAEVYLEKNGWLKIDHNRVYGYFDWNEDYADEHYCPTPEQIDTVCDYADEFYKGLLMCSTDFKPTRTYELRQMGRIRLHELFAY